MRLRKQIIFLAMALLLLMALTSCGDKATEPKTEKVTIPTITPNGGTYSSVTIVTISCPTEGSQIRYTTDGSEPTLSSLVYIN